MAKVEERKARGEIEPWAGAAKQLSILDADPIPGRIISVKEYPYLNAEELTLENGMKVS